ncbi:ABC transporter substrate-binding protein [Rhodococcus koreensis]
MNITRPSRFGLNHPLRWALGAAVACATLTACGGGSGSDTNTSDVTVPSVEAGQASTLVPEEFKNKPIRVAVGNDYPPYHYMDADNQIAGVNPDLATALGQDLGVEFEIIPVGFDDIIAGLQNGRYDLSIPAFNITPERTKVLDFVTYVDDKTAFMTGAGSDFTITKADDMCGHKVAVAKGTAQADELGEYDAQCQSAGLPAIEIITFTANSDAATAVRSGRVDAACATYSQLDYVATTAEGQFEVSDFKGSSTPLAIGLPKGSTLSPSMLQAVKDVQANGAYAKVLEKNQVPDLALQNPTLVTEPTN